VVTGAELKAIREAFGLSAAAMGRLIGYSGPKANIAVHIRRPRRSSHPLLDREACAHVCAARNSPGMVNRLFLLACPRFLALNVGALPLVDRRQHQV
jgi:hypothetical protein